MYLLPYNSAIVRIQSLKILFMRSNLYPRAILNFIYLFLLVSAPASGVFAQASNSLLFRDDFDRTFLGNFWDAQESWSIVDGAAFNFIDGTGGTLTTANNYAETSYVIETSAKGFTDNYYREFRITFGQADLSNQELYQVKYTAYGGGRLTLSKSTDNIYAAQVLDEVAVFPALNSVQWYNFKIAKYKSGLIQVYLDEGSGYPSIPVLEAIDSAYPALGHTGWQVDTQTFAENFYVDWISASTPAVEKPAIKEKPDEDNLITQVSAKSGKPYKVAKLIPGVKQLIDRDYTITSVPDYLTGASFIQSANNDKYSTIDSFLTFFVKSSAVLYVGYDPRGAAIPEWLNQWTKTQDRIEVSDQKPHYLEVYSRSVDFGEVYPYPVVLGANLSGRALGAKTNYLLAALKRPETKSLQAEDAFLSGVQVAKDHINYNGTGFADFINPSGDYIEWTVNIDVPGTYNLGFKFSNGGFTYRSLEISDNGKDYGTADFSPTFSWDSWAFLSGPNIFLSSGTHKIRATATDNSGPNIDELSMFYISPAAPSIAPPQNLLARNKPGAESHNFYYKAYPNPFLQGTKIYYGLKEKANVILSVYTLQGQEVQVIEKRIREAGNYEANFNADKLAKGAYILRLQIGNEVRTGKLIKD